MPQTKRTTPLDGRSKTPEYRAWNSMKNRCFSPRNERYARYGGRGITVCPEWRDDYPAFLSHIGPRPSKGHSVDRINNDGNYEPGNVRWATAQQQSYNRSTNLKPGTVKHVPGAKGVSLALPLTPEAHIEIDELMKIVSRP